VSEIPSFLILMRHGTAAEKIGFGGRDSSRPLTPEGIDLTNAVSDRLVKLYPPTLILTSEYVRARQTADCVLRAAESANKKNRDKKNPRLMVVPELNQDRPWGDWREAWREIQEQLEPDEIVVAVGHGPSINEILCWHSGIDFNVGMKKAGIAVLKDAQRLVAYVPPHVMV
jgi:phosphohistidine phosphatase SixA